MMCFIHKTLTFVLQTDRQGKDRSIGRLIIQVKNDGGLDQSENHEVAKKWILQRTC